MDSKDECVFNEDVKQKIYNLYRESNLAVLEYIVEITKTWDDMAYTFLQVYNCAEDEDDTVKVFWEAMRYYGLINYINEQERKL